MPTSWTLWASSAPRYFSSTTPTSTRSSASGERLSSTAASEASSSNRWVWMIAKISSFLLG